MTGDNDKMSQRCRQDLLLLWCCKLCLLFSAVSAAVVTIACCRHVSIISCPRAAYPRSL
jgi:hypothetical protein